MPSGKGTHPVSIVSRIDARPLFNQNIISCLVRPQICFYGRHVFMGYLNNEEKTTETIDDEGWLHSGDIGRVDEVGMASVVKPHLYLNCCSGYDVLHCLF